MHNSECSAILVSSADIGFIVRGLRWLHMFISEAGLSMLCERNVKSGRKCNAEGLEELRETSTAGVNPVFNMFLDDLLIVSHSLHVDPI